MRQVVTAKWRSRAVDLYHEAPIAGNTFAEQLSRPRTVGGDERQPRGSDAREFGPRIIEQDATRFGGHEVVGTFEDLAQSSVKAHVPTLGVLIPSCAEEEAGDLLR